MCVCKGDSFGLRSTKECSMTYRQSETYSHNMRYINMRFISFDIADFYPSISENLLDLALSWASSLAEISH